MTTPTDELLPCPFCGASGALIAPNRGRGMYVGCHCCQASVFACVEPVLSAASAKAAIAAWNTRAQSARIAELEATVENLEARLREAGRAKTNGMRDAAYIAMNATTGTAAANQIRREALRIDSLADAAIDAMFNQEKGNG